MSRPHTSLASRSWRSHTSATGTASRSSTARSSPGGSSGARSSSSTCGPRPSTRPGTSPAPARSRSANSDANSARFRRMPMSWPTAGARTACTRTTPCVSSTARASGPDDSSTGFPSGNEPACPWLPGTETTAMAEDVLVDPEILREQVRDKYREVAVDPHRTFHFHTGRPLAARLGYEREAVDALPERAVESFAGVGNPFWLRRLQPGERVVDVGSGAGFDSFIAAGQVGSSGRVVGVDMTPEMLTKSRQTADALGLDHVEFREGLAESIPVQDSWADVVISNGVINLCADKKAVFEEIRRVLKPGGVLQFADIANGRPAPPEALRDSG